MCDVYCVGKVVIVVVLSVTPLFVCCHISSQPFSKTAFLIHRISFSTSSSSTSPRIDPKNLEKSNLPKNNTEKEITINLDRRENTGEETDSGRIFRPASVENKKKENLCLREKSYHLTQVYPIKTLLYVVISVLFDGFPTRSNIFLFSKVL